ncbi:helix-turn-helix domain-containing protein [Kitasatospora sp. NPDC004531]
MTARSGAPMGFAEAFDLPLTIDLRTAARAVGVCPNTAYKLIRLGTFPCPVLRVGRKYRIATAELMRSLGIDERPIYASDLEAGATYAAQFDNSCITETEDPE